MLPQSSKNLTTFSMFSNLQESDASVTLGAKTGQSNLEVETTLTTGEKA